MKTVFIVIMFSSEGMVLKAVFDNAFAAVKYCSRWGKEITHKVGLADQIWSNGVCHFIVKGFTVRE